MRHKRHCGYPVSAANGWKLDTAYRKGIELEEAALLGNLWKNNKAVKTLCVAQTCRCQTDTHSEMKQKQVSETHNLILTTFN
jgi:hypothetical protein